MPYFQRTDDYLPTKDHHETRGKVANTTALLRGPHRSRSPLQLLILHPTGPQRNLGKVFLVKVLAQLTENQSEAEGSGDI